MDSSACGYLRATGAVERGNGAETAQEMRCSSEQESSVSMERSSSQNVSQLRREKVMTLGDAGVLFRNIELLAFRVLSHCLVSPTRHSPYLKTMSEETLTFQPSAREGYPFRTAGQLIAPQGRPQR